MGRKPTCLCGECEKCKRREHYQKHRQKIYELYQKGKIITQSKKTIRKLMFVEIIDNTMLGLDIDICRVGRSIRVTVSLPGKEQEINKYDINRIKILEHV